MSQENTWAKVQESALARKAERERLWKLQADKAERLKQQREQERLEKQQEAKAKQDQLDEQARQVSHLIL